MPLPSPQEQVSLSAPLLSREVALSPVLFQMYQPLPRGPRVIRVPRGELIKARRWQRCWSGRRWHTLSVWIGSY
jgi:hypothetical protein